jgi:2'-5' RNA ligase
MTDDSAPDPITRRMNNPLRLFVAIPAPEAIRKATAAAIGELRRFGDVRWATPERLHLTLKFLGITSEEKIPKLEEDLGRIANDCLHFAIELDRIGAFPSIRRPQTVWYGISGDTDALSALAGRIEAGMERLGFEKEARPYRPHLTLGRVRSPRGLRDLATELEKRAAETPSDSESEIEWSVDAIALMRSELKPNGPVYTELSHFPLATTCPSSEQEQERRPDGQ